MTESGVLAGEYQAGSRIHLPTESGYEQRVGAWNQLVRHAPAVVVAPSDAADVAAAVRLAGALGGSIRVQATGHGALAAATGGVLIESSELNHVTVDPVAGTVVIGAGARWRDVIEAAAPHGLAPLSGSTSNLGAVGFCLGGGKSCAAAGGEHRGRPVRADRPDAPPGTARPVRRNPGAQERALRPPAARPWADRTSGGGQEFGWSAPGRPGRSPPARDRSSPTEGPR